MSRRNYKAKTKNAKRISAVINVTVIVVAAAVIVLAGILKGITDSYIEQSTKAQQQYCLQIADSLSFMYENGYSDEEVARYLAENVEASGSRWAFLYKGDTVLFAKNNTTTEALNELRDSAAFMSELRSQDAEITTEEFEADGVLYTVGVINDRDNILISGSIKTYRVYIILLFSVIILMGVSTVIALAGAWIKSERKLEANRQELKLRNEEFEKAHKNNLEDKNVSFSSMPNKRENDRYKQYKFKFYLNARHAIYIDGLLGTVHPHTWEITLNVIKRQDGFIEFNKLEKKIEEFIKPYQNKELNEEEPFDTINPTLENCCDYFKEQISNILDKEGWVLLMMEMSETPSRSYVISMLDENKLD